MTLILGFHSSLVGHLVGEQALEALSPVQWPAVLVVDSVFKGRRTHKNPWAEPWRLN
jgi:hypothetical protein